MGQFLHSFAQLAATPIAAKLKQQDVLRQRAANAAQTFKILTLRELAPGTAFRFIQHDGKPGPNVYVVGAPVNPLADLRQFTNKERGYWSTAKANSRVIVRE